MPTHDYKWQGRRVKGVTTIINGNLGWNKRALMHWAWTQGRDGMDYRQTSQRAADIGTIAHAMVECDLHGKPFDGSPYNLELLSKASVAFDAWQDWKHDKAIEPIAIETPLVACYTNDMGEQFAFGGTIDSVAMKYRNDRVRSIVDLKTSNATYPDHLIQLAAYGFLWEFNHPDEPIERYSIVRIDKNDGSFHHHSYIHLDKYRQVFLRLLEIDYLKDKIGG